MDVLSSVNLFLRSFQPQRTYLPTYSAGIDTRNFNIIYSHQRQTNWCAAACIQTIAAHYGIEISQEDLARNHCATDHFNNPRNCPATDYVITGNLNFCHNIYHNQLKRVCISSTLEKGDIDFNAVIRELQENRPVMVAYRPQGSSIGHAVIITGITWQCDNGIHYIQQLVIRDPWPSQENINNYGRKVITNVRDFESRIFSHWYISISVSDIHHRSFQRRKSWQPYSF